LISELLLLIGGLLTLFGGLLPSFNIGGLQIGFTTIGIALLIMALSSFFQAIIGITGPFWFGIVILVLGIVLGQFLTESGFNFIQWFRSLLFHGP